MIPHTPVDVAGTGSAVQLSTLLGATQCRWFQVTGVSVGSTPVRVGDSGISTSRGVPVVAGGGAFAPPVGLQFEFYDLEKWYVLIQSGDTASVACAI